MGLDFDRCAGSGFNRSSQQRFILEVRSGVRDRGLVGGVQSRRLVSGLQSHRLGHINKGWDVRIEDDFCESGLAASRFGGWVARRRQTMANGLGV